MVKRLAIIATVLLVVGMTGVGFTIKSQFKQAKTLEQKTIAAAEFDKIDLHANNSEVIFTSTNDDHATVELNGNKKEYFLTVEADNEILKVDFKSKQKIFSFDILPNKMTINVELPEKIYENVQATSDNGSIELTDLQSNELNVNTENGKIKLTKIKSNVLHAETHNGVINAKNVDTDTANIETHNGVVTMDHVRGEVVGKTHNGIINFRTDHLDQNIELQADNGKIDVRSDEKPTNATLDFQTGNGKIRYFGEKNWDTVIGDGNHLISLRTGNGKITVK